MSISYRCVFLAVAAATGLSACASDPRPHVPIPEDPGLYAVPALREDPDDEDYLQRLDGDEDWETETWNEREDLSPDVQFVIQDPALAGGASAQDLVELWRVAWVRSELRSDGGAAPVQGSQWQVARLDPFRVPLVYRQVAGHPGTIHAVPQERLPGGLYSLQLRNSAAPRSARFGVDWDILDRQDYSAANCVDRRSGGSSYVLCGAPQTVASPAGAGGLEISLLDPVAQTVSGQRILVLQGVITNEGSATRAIPPLEAALQDRNGAVLGRWSFAAEQPQLDPGESSTFRTEIRDAPAETSRVNVTFQRSAASAQ